VRRSTIAILLAAAWLAQAGLDPLPAAAQTAAASRIAAVVNDDIVSTQDLRERLRLALLLSGLPNDADTQRRLAPQVLQRVIDERLQLQEAGRRGVVVQPQEVSGAMQSTAAANNMTPDQLRTFLRDQGIDPRALEQQIAAELTWLRFVQREFADRVVVTDQQLDLAVAAAAQGGQTELLLSEILLPVYDPAQTAEVLADAEELRTTIRQGADFAAVARQVSASGSRNEGGDLGWVPINAVQTSLQPILADLGPGQVSDPVTTPSGVQLFLVRDRRVSGTQPASDLRRIAQLLFPLAPDASNAEVEAVLSVARTAAAEVDNCRDMERVARQRALPGSGDMGWMRANELPPELAPVLANLPLETVSRPARTASGVHFLMVCADGRSDADEAVRAGLRRSMEQEQLERLAGRYLRDLRKDAFIDVRVGG
jgi:peptidyl-prolyl cis-trans isomerase SurA